MSSFLRQISEAKYLDKKVKYLHVVLLGESAFAEKLAI